MITIEKLYNLLANNNFCFADPQEDLLLPDWVPANTDDKSWGADEPFDDATLALAASVTDSAVGIHLYNGKRLTEIATVALDSEFAAIESVVNTAIAIVDALRDGQ